MVVDKLFEFIEDIERFCVNHKWSRFFNDWETGDEALDEYAMIYKNCCNDVDEEKDAANDIFTELTEYMDCLYNYIDVDYVKLLDDEKQNARKWLDKVEKVIGSCVFSLKGNDLKGFLIKGYQMCHLIKEAAVKTPDEYYGGRRTDVMPYYLGENKEQLFDSILNEADDTYKAKVGSKWLKGNKLVKDKKDADTFESKTEPTQRINQMKKDGKLNKNAKPSVIKESLTFDDTIRRCVHIESEEDLEDSPFTYYLDVDIGDTVYICEDADVYMREDKNGWVIFWHNKFMEHIPLSLLDRDDKEAYTSKYRQAQNRYKAICNAALDGTLEKEFLPKNGKPSFDHSNAAEVFKQFGENKINKNQFFEYLLEAVEDFPRNTRAMYRFAKRRHNDTGAVRKVSGQPYWVHPEGVAKIVMEHGGSDIEIKAAFCHDVLEDTGDSYEDLEEKFGEKVASIVKEVTNDKFEIARVGKEKYISEELCRLSPEALTVKLADMLYNMKDSPTESNYERMRKNIAFLMMNRQLNGIHLALAEEILEV